MGFLLTRLRRPSSKAYYQHPTQETKDLDIVSRLPYELRDVIFAELDLASVTAALSVCRTWRDCWPSLARRWFPGLAEHVRAAAAGGWQGGDAAELCRRSLHRIQRRTSGRFASAFQHTMCLESERFFELDRGLPAAQGGVHQYDGLHFSGISTRFPRFMMYSGGRIAWWPELYGSPFFAIVDDLRARARRAYLFPDNGGRRQGFKTAMSADLFVMSLGTTVNAWHFALGCLQSVEAPEFFERCVTEGERILLVSETGRVYSWTFGGALRHIDVHGLGCYPAGRVAMGGLEDFSYRFSSHHIGLRFRKGGMLIDFIVHPTLQDVFFIITLGADAPRKLIVYEIHEEQLIGTYTFDHHLISTPNIGDVGYLRWEKVDSYGGYCLAHAWLEDLNFGTPEGITEPNNPLPGCSHQCDMHGLISVCFNIYTRRFTILHHPIAKNTPSVHHLWNGQIITNNSNGQPGSPTEGLIFAVNSCSTSHDRNSSEGENLSIPLYTATPGKDGVLQRRYRVDLAAEDLQGGRNVEFTLNPHQRFGTHRNWASEYGGVKRLVGDDDFLLFVDGGNYTAWSFGDEIPEYRPDDGQFRWWKKFHQE